MGLIKAAAGAVGGIMADQWREYFYCEAIPANVLALKGQKRTSGRSSNKHGSDNVISNGSVIAIADGQCMLIVENGQVVDICAEPGEFTYDMSSEPSLFYGSLSQTIPAVFKNIGKRFTFGGLAPTDQRVYFINTKELIGNKYGTPSPIPFRVVDNNIGLDIDIAIRCFGEYSYRITNPILFYTNVCGNVSDAFTRDKLDGQIKSELLTALQPTFARISEMGIRYSALPGHTRELANSLNQELSAQWRDLRGIEIVAIGVSSVKASDEDEAMIKELQRNAALSNPKMAAGHMVGAQAQAMQDAAKNKGGAALGFMGMNMVQNAGGINTSDLFGMAQQQMLQPTQNNQSTHPVSTIHNAPTAHNDNPGTMPKTRTDTNSKSKQELKRTSWTCPSCGHNGNLGKFCSECGQAQPVNTSAGWVCSCGSVNKGKFCPECGAKKPVGIPQYRCDKCGWEPTDPTKPPKFCPECGDPFGQLPHG